jgi:hypothetical protein
VIISAASGLPQAEIAVPLYSPNTDSLVGVWTGAIDFDLLNEGFQLIDLANDERVDILIIMVPKLLTRMTN